MPMPVARIEFAPGSATLPAGASAALKPFCTASAPVPVIARAPTDPNDPSGAMRLSMARTFAIRDALTACGVPAQNIIPRASGSVPGADDNEALIGASAAP
ncbi:MAG: OmpA family protein [Rhodospirillales bacterium]|nr:OmpA family protein [Rhodospirillales bacterium]MDE2390664.1 OmpA family protein [Rhodospirillales bacterium]